MNTNKQPYNYSLCKECWDTGEINEGVFSYAESWANSSDRFNHCQKHLKMLLDEEEKRLNAGEKE